MEGEGGQGLGEAEAQVKRAMAARDTAGSRDIPIYLEQKDTRGKLAAKSAWKLFIGQNPALRTRSFFALDLIAVYELLRL